MTRKYLVSRQIDLLAVLSVVVILLLSGCGTSPTSASSGKTTTTPTGAASGRTGSATLKHVPRGTSTISWNPTGQELTVKLSLFGLAPNSTHPAQIHSGSCAKQGAVLYTLNNVLADARGVGSSTTVIKNVKTVPTTGNISVHNGPGLAPADESLPIVCSDLALNHISPTTMTSVQVPLNAAPASSPSETASGTAQLTVSGSTLTVKLNLSGLQPGSSHAAHIHAGSCESQGAVIYPLSNVVADASGKSISTTTIKNVSSIPGHGWYVHVHYSTDIATPTGFDPIACGNVTVG